jgi:hypothetical protein
LGTLPKPIVTPRVEKRVDEGPVHDYLAVEDTISRIKNHQTKFTDFWIGKLLGSRL